MQVHGIIPARYDSSRFPGKPLVDIKGKSMIRRVYEQCKKSRLLSSVYVATDDDRIMQEVISFGGQAVMTSRQHQSGTDRIAEAAEIVGGADFVINIQGDEPFIDPQLIDQVILPLQRKSARITTAATPIKKEEILFDPNTVKVVLNQRQHALYFSRHSIPFQRGVERRNWLNQGHFYQHIGIYGFAGSLLSQLTRMPVSKLEQQEALEQLRWLDNGESIYVHITEYQGLSIDVPSDLEKIDTYGH
jgi:3-deoxy-manno-octulosonate cytidylyltransferase (CMP-KDO synthetase)